MKTSGARTVKAMMCVYMFAAEALGCNAVANALCWTCKEASLHSPPAALSPPAASASAALAAISRTLVMRSLDDTGRPGSGFGGVVTFSAPAALRFAPRCPLSLLAVSSWPSRNSFARFGWKSLFSGFLEGREDACLQPADQTFWCKVVKQKP